MLHCGKNRKKKRSHYYSSQTQPINETYEVRNYIPIRDKNQKNSYTPWMQNKKNLEIDEVKL